MYRILIFFTTFFLISIVFVNVVPARTLEDIYYRVEDLEIYLVEIQGTNRLVVRNLGFLEDTVKQNTEKISAMESANSENFDKVNEDLALMIETQQGLIQIVTDLTGIVFIILVSGSVILIMLFLYNVLKKFI